MEYPVITVTTVCVFTFAVNDIGICFMLNLFADALIYKPTLIYTSSRLLVLVTLTSWITRESPGARWLNRSCIIAFDVLLMALCVDFILSTPFWIGIWILRGNKEIYSKIRKTSVENVKKLFRLFQVVLNLCRGILTVVMWIEPDFTYSSILNTFSLFLFNIQHTHITRQKYMFRPLGTIRRDCNRSGALERKALDQSAIEIPFLWLSSHGGESRGNRYELIPEI